MQSTIKRILGEQEDELEEIPGGAEKNVNNTAPGAPEDAEVDELANLWTMGNKGEVVHRFLEMDNETSVRLVFAIGREGALELARMVDQQVEQQEPASAESTEPEHIEPAPSDQVGEIIGNEEVRGFHRPHVMPP